MCMLLFSTYLPDLHSTLLHVISTKPWWFADHSKQSGLGTPSKHVSPRTYSLSMSLTLLQDLRYTGWELKGPDTHAAGGGLAGRPFL